MRFTEVSTDEPAKFLQQVENRFDNAKESARYISDTR